MARSRAAAVALPLLSLWLLFLLGGCAPLFEFNLFRSVDPVSLPTPAELDSMSEGEALNYLEQELSSPVFVEKLLEDEAALGAVDALLFECMTASPDPDSRKRSAVLYADLRLAASGALEAVDNAYALLSLDPGSLDFSDPAAVLDFLQALVADTVPPAALDSREAFDALLEGFQTAWQGYERLGNELGADPAVPDGLNLGDAVQKALFSYLVTEALRTDGLYASELEARDALWVAARGEEPPAPTGSGTYEDPFVPGSALQNILYAAGIVF